MASTTKAGKLWQLLHTNDQLGADLLNAVAKDSPDLANAALAAAKLTVDDFMLTKEEQTDFLRGFTPSGALELTSWEGYYVTQLPDGGKRALFILSADNSVYWGPQSQADADFESLKVDYQLPEDGTLRLSTQDGAVNLVFSRTVENDTVSLGSFKGTVGSTAIEGVHALPPIPDDARAPPPVPDTPAPPPNSDTPAPPPPIPSPHTDTEVTASGIHVAVKAFGAMKAPGGVKGVWSKWIKSETARNVATTFGIVGGVKMFAETVHWGYNTFVAKDDKMRKEHSQRFKDKLKESPFRDCAYAVMHEKAPYPDIAWDGYTKQLSNKTVQEVNKLIHSKKMDYVGDHEVSEIVEDLRDDVKKAMHKEMTDHAKSYIKPTVLQKLAAWKAFPEHELWADAIASERAEGHATERLKSLGDPIVDTITEIAVHNARNTYFAKASTDNLKKYQAADAAADKNKKVYDGVLQKLKTAQKKLDGAKVGGDPAAISAAQKEWKTLDDERDFQEKEVKTKRKQANDYLETSNLEKDRAKNAKHEGNDAKAKLDKLLENHGK